jgi:hypothetical protein
VTGNTVPEHVVLVDDLITTGSTAIECADVLHRAGARSVTVVCLGYTQAGLPSSGGDAPGLVCSCEERLVTRLNGKTDGAFWECTRVFTRQPGRVTRAWREGLRAYNALNTRDHVDDARDVPV